MIEIRPAGERGRTAIDWLDSRHSFSFGGYHDPRRLGFRSLRVLNEDRVAPGAGFGTHGHRDMEILSYVLEGALQHKDSLGNGAVLRPGEIQFMRAGTGVMHSEFNPSNRESVHFLQIWIVPRERGLAPAYAQRPVDSEAAAGALVLVASGDGRAESIRLAQDVDLYVGRLAAGERRAHALAPGRHGWLQIARGRLQIGRRELQEGDGVAVSEESAIELEALASAELLLFDLG
jgi:hypothetical protein